MKECVACGGDGNDPNTSWRCPVCGGSGKVTASPDLRALVEKLNEQRDKWEAIHDGETSATDRYNTAVEIITAIDEQLAALTGAGEQQ